MFSDTTAGSRRKTSWTHGCWQRSTKGGYVFTDLWPTVTFYVLPTCLLTANIYFHVENRNESLCSRRKERGREDDQERSHFLRYLQIPLRHPPLLACQDSPQMMKSRWKRSKQVQGSSLGPRRGLRSCWPGRILHAGRSVGGNLCMLTSRQKMNLLLSLLATITWSDRRGWSFALAWRNLSSPPASLTLVSPARPGMKVPPAVPLAIPPPNPGLWVERGPTAPWSHPVAQSPSTELVHPRSTRCRCLSWSALCWMLAASKQFLWKTPVLHPLWVCTGALVGVKESSVLRSA